MKESRIAKIRTNYVIKIEKLQIIYFNVIVAWLVGRLSKINFSIEIQRNSLQQKRNKSVRLRENITANESEPSYKYK